MQLQDRKAELINAARALLDGRVHWLEAVRKIRDLSIYMENPDDADFQKIRAIESQTDNFPVGAVRQEFADDYLRRLDVELQEYYELEKNDLFAACHRIVTQLGD